MDRQDPGNNVALSVELLQRGVEDSDLDVPLSYLNRLLAECSSSQHVRSYLADLLAELEKRSLLPKIISLYGKQHLEFLGTNKISITEGTGGTYRITKVTLDRVIATPPWAGGPPPVDKMIIEQMRRHFDKIHDGYINRYHLDKFAERKDLKTS